MLVYGEEKPPPSPFPLPLRISRDFPDSFLGVHLFSLVNRDTVSVLLENTIVDPLNLPFVPVLIGF